MFKGLRFPATYLFLGFAPKTFLKISYACEPADVFFTLPRFIKINIYFNRSSWQNVVTYLESNEDSTLKACVGRDGWITVSQVTEYDGYKERSKYFRWEPCREKVRFCLRGIINLFLYWTDSKTKFEAIFFCMIYTWVYYASTEGKKIWKAYNSLSKQKIGNPKQSIKRLKYLFRRKEESPELWLKTKSVM